MNTNSKLIVIVNEWLRTIFEGPISIVSGAIEDQLHYWRLKNRLKILEKAKDLCEKYNVEPMANFPGIFFELATNAGNVNEEVLADSYSAIC